MKRAATAVLVIVALILFVALLFAAPAYFRYQKRADARNEVKVTSIQIQNQAQRVKIAKQKAQIRYQNSVGIREAQDEIAKTLTPLYVQFELAEAMKQIALTGKNNTVVFVPTTTDSGLPIVPGITEKVGQRQQGDKG